VLENRWTGHVFTPLESFEKSGGTNSNCNAQSPHPNIYRRPFQEMYYDDGVAPRGACREIQAASETASMSTDGGSSVGSLGSFDTTSISSATSTSGGNHHFGNTPIPESTVREVSLPPLRVLGGLGMGGFAVVVSVLHLGTGETLAMKVIAKESAVRPKDRMRIAQELNILRELPPCPFISHCHFAFESPSSIFFVMDLCTGGDLFYHLEKSTMQGVMGLGEETSKMILAETASGLIHLHSNHIVHRDIKVENIMLDRSGHVKIIDFGLTRKIKSEVDRFTPTGSLIYMAPELLHAKVGGRFTDWWAFGVVAHELLTGRSPWSSLTDKVIIRSEIKSLKLTFPSSMSPSASELLKGLLEREPSRRLGSGHIQEVIAAPFFSDIDFHALWRGELPGVLISDTVCVRRDDNESALACYRSRQPMLNNPSLEWTLGVDSVLQHPS
jgi:serine/threonine protein kinase